MDGVEGWKKSERELSKGCVWMIEWIDHKFKMAGDDVIDMGIGYEVYIHSNRYWRGFIRSDT